MHGLCHIHGCILVCDSKPTSLVTYANLKGLFRRQLFHHRPWALRRATLQPRILNRTSTKMNNTKKWWVTVSDCPYYSQRNSCRCSTLNDEAHSKSLKLSVHGVAHYVIQEDNARSVIFALFCFSFRNRPNIRRRSKRKKRMKRRRRRKSATTTTTTAKETGGIRCRMAPWRRRSLYQSVAFQHFSTPQCRVV